VKRFVGFLLVVGVLLASSGCGGDAEDRDKNRNKDKPRASLRQPTGGERRGVSPPVQPQPAG
jgi:hypothetical protein